ncbi:MAG: hypothetical protein QM754_17705 [Tepidisphaeraceae bacterium]
MLAGPNGSGKSTLFEDLRKNLPLGHWLNPDKVEREMVRDGGIDFSKWGLQVSQDELHGFIRSHGLFQSLSDTQRITLPSVHANRLTVTLPSERTYLNAILCDYLRTDWLRHRTSFTFETVMSHPSKIDFFLDATRTGYRTYLYYICTDDPIINQARVQNRVLTGGHDVDPDKIVERYGRSLALLPEVIAAASRAYLFDNSTQAGHQLFAEFTAGQLTALAPERPPNWAVRSGILK